MTPEPTANLRTHYPTPMAHIILRSFEEILGEPGFSNLLAQAGLDHLKDPLANEGELDGLGFDELATLHSVMERRFGLNAGRGMAIRAGRVCFRAGLKRFGDEMGLSAQDFRLLPLGAKLRRAAAALANTLNRQTGQEVTLEYGEDVHRLLVRRCAVCWDRTADSACCHLTVGLIQESLFWLSGGHSYPVNETECLAAGGDACVFEIGRQPID